MRSSFLLFSTWRECPSTRTLRVAAIAAANAQRSAARGATSTMGPKSWRAPRGCPRARQSLPSRRLRALLRLPESMVEDTSFHAKVRSFFTFPGQSETYIRIVYFSESSSEFSCNAEQTTWKVTPSVQSPVTKFPCRISRVSVDNLLESLLQNICHDERLTSPSQHSGHGLSAR